LIKRFKKNKSMEEKIKQKGFIQIPLLAAVILVSISAVSLGTGAILYKQQRTPLFTANISEVIYKTVYEREFEMEELKQEAELSKIKKERAEKYAQKEIVKRAEAEAARGEAEQITQQETTKRIQEEKARKVAEEKAEEETIKRANEEAKRAKEELERKIAEQKLSEKEAEEKRMNADNDGDGLTFREEEQKGTSDLDLDSDDDGIPDGEDINPVGGGEYKPQHFEWEYDGTVWSWTYSVHEDWYNYYNNKSRASHGLEYVTADDPFIQEIAKALKETAEKKSYHLSSFIISFVQGLPYVADFYTNIADLPKYPVETFIDRNGDCEDFSYLSASLITATDIGVALIEFDDHMAIGIKTVPEQDGSYYEIGDDRYYYFETTAEDWRLGEIPDEYKNKRAKIIRVWDGKTINSYAKYKKPCNSSSDFAGYYYDGSNYYSDSKCNNLAYCLPYKEFYINPQITNKLYWDSSCSQEAILGCYKSEIYSGKFYKSGNAWYYDSQCKQLYKSMDCDYPSPWDYTCTSESTYDSKKSNCDYYKASEYFQSLAEGCDEKVAQCRRDIDEYQMKKDEYNQCKNRKEY
jgi:hypothetical protein